MPKDNEHILPSAIRFYLRSTVGSLMGDDQSQQAPFTELDMTKGELEAIRAAIANAKKDGRDYISYEDYPTKEKFWKDGGGLLSDVDMLFDDPARSAMMSLGMAKFDKDGVVTDSYDFGATPDVKIQRKDWFAAIKDKNPRAKLNFIGNAVGLRSGTGRKVTIRTQEDVTD